MSVASATGADHPFVSRADSFFGLHFDLHPGKTDKTLGADITEDMIDHLLNRVHPDFVQYDCKGHGGYTGYPTKVGYPCPGIVKDSLAIWRKVTREHGVGLFIHYSGIWDEVAVANHPEWARIEADGKLDAIETSTFGPYVDKLMIPQLKEATSAYGVDGVWVDSECWGARLDYSPAALAAWKMETGLDKAPKGRNEPNWFEWKMFQRRQFEKYICHWVDALHAFNPKLQITSNWAYTTLMPKPVVAKLDFLSGDYSATNSVNSARMEARYVASNGMPWDLMAWGFNQADKLGWSYKPAVQLEQEASVVLMQGGGFQIYYNPTRSGYICDTIINTTGKVADFCRARQEACHKSKSVPQVALLLSTETQDDARDYIYNNYDGVLDDLQGSLHALLELHYSVDILAEHQIEDRLSEFPVVVVPDAYKLTDKFKAKLVEYANNGGSLVLLGQKCAKLFQPELGVEFVDDPQDVATMLATTAGPVSENGIWQRVKPTTSSVIGLRYPTVDTRKPGEVAATVVKCGKGQIAAVYGPVGSNFLKSHHPYLRGFIGEVVAKVFPNPAVQVDGPPCIDVALRNTKDGKLSVQLLNTANAPTQVASTVPMSESYCAIDSIPASGPVTVKLKVAAKPKNVRWVPDGGKIGWSWSAGVLSVKVPSIGIHGVLVIEEKE